jgi:hypothetical protein
LRLFQDRRCAWRHESRSLRRRQKIKNRLFLSVIADRIAEVRHVLPKSVHRVAAGQAEQQPSQSTEREATQ